MNNSVIVTMVMIVMTTELRSLHINYLEMEQLLIWRGG